jgi:hypothetical protein
VAYSAWRRASDDAGASARQQYEVAGRTARRRRSLRRLFWAGGLVAMACGLWAKELPLGIAGLALAIAAASMRTDRDPERWLRGAEGERRSAVLLQRLRAPRWHVLHDRMVPGRSINLDHLVIGPSGVWVVDTKVYRARLRRRWRRVEVGGRLIDTGPATWEAELVSERLGVAVTPVVAVHGMGLGPRGGCCDGVRVIPATALVRWLRRGGRMWWLGRRPLRRAEVQDLAARADLLFPSRSRPAAVGGGRRGGFR